MSLEQLDLNPNDIRIEELQELLSKINNNSDFNLD